MSTSAQAGVGPPPVTFDLPASFEAVAPFGEYVFAARALGRVEGRQAMSAAFLTARWLTGPMTRTAREAGNLGARDDEGAVFHDFRIPAGECAVRLGAWRAAPDPLPGLGVDLPRLEMQTALAVFGPAPGTDLWSEIYLGVASTQDWEEYSRLFLHLLFSARFADTANPAQGTDRPSAPGKGSP